MCEIANDNEPNQIVLSGKKSIIEKVCENAKSLGAKRAILLPVSAPFHCSLMVPAQKNMVNLISEVNLGKPGNEPKRVWSFKSKENINKSISGNWVFENSENEANISEYFVMFLF